jgi:uncharacterized protein
LIDVQVGRRDFLRSGLIATGAALAGPSVWRAALAAPAQPGPGPYGELKNPDVNGIMLPEGFTSRLIALSGRQVAHTPYNWHDYPDGGATYPTDQGGWIYVSNSEVADTGGAGAVRFDNLGNIVDAYRILEGTSRNCAGGPTPWGTWLSCEETSRGRVWECDPTGKREPILLSKLGTFQHEAAAVDPGGRRVYLTEDRDDGGFYRFTPRRYPNLAAGVLEIARVEDIARVHAGGASAVTWRPIPDPEYFNAEPTRRQVGERTPFAGGEGCWFDSGIVYFTTKRDNRVWSYRTADATIELLYDGTTTQRILLGVDNVFVSPRSGDVFVAEDGDDLDIVMITAERRVTRLLKLVGSVHQGSELTGPALNPAGDRFYFSSQRSFGKGATYEVTGPFRTTRATTPSATPTASAVPSTPAAAAGSSILPAPASPVESSDNTAGKAVFSGALAVGGAAAAVVGAKRLRGRRKPEEL